MEAFEEYLEIKQVGKISPCQILGCFLNIHQGKAIKQPIACIFCQEQHSPLSLIFLSSSLRMNEIKIKKAASGSWSPFQVCRNILLRRLHTHKILGVTGWSAHVPFNVSATTTPRSKCRMKESSTEGWPRAADNLVANSKLKSHGVTEGGEREGNICSGCQKSLHISLC